MTAMSRPKKGARCLIIYLLIDTPASIDKKARYYTILAATVFSLVLQIALSHSGANYIHLLSLDPSSVYRARDFEHKS